MTVRMVSMVLRMPRAITVLSSLSSYSSLCKTLLKISACTEEVLRLHHGVHVLLLLVFLGWEFSPNANKMLVKTLNFLYIKLAAVKRF